MPLTPAKARRPGLWIGTLALALMAFGTPHASAQTLERIRRRGHDQARLRPDARPFSFGAEGEQPAGYAVALCTLVADQIKTALGRADLAVEWVPLELGRLAPTPCEDGAVDLLCSATPETLSARERVSFSIPIFPSGTGALLSANAPLALREILAHGQPTEPADLARLSGAHRARAHDVLSHCGHHERSLAEGADRDVPARCHGRPGPDGRRGHPEQFWTARSERALRRFAGPPRRRRAQRSLRQPRSFSTATLPTSRSLSRCAAETKTFAWRSIGP